MHNRSAKNPCLLTVSTLQLRAGVGVGEILTTPVNGGLDLADCVYTMFSRAEVCSNDGQDQLSLA